MQFAIMGQYALEQGMDVTPDLWPTELDAMKFVAQLFQHELGAILHLQNVTPGTLRKLSKGKKKSLLKNQKRKLEFMDPNPDETGRSNKRRRLTECEETQEYLTAFLDKEIEFMEDGLLNFPKKTSKVQGEPF